MTYTNVWTNVLPLGSQQASTADDEIRKVRLDLYERLLTLVEDFDEDPLQLRDSAIPPTLNVLATGYTQILPKYAFSNNGAVGSSSPSICTIPGFFNGGFISGVAVYLLPGSPVTTVSLNYIDLVTGSIGLIGSKQAVANSILQPVIITDGLPYQLIGTRGHYIEVTTSSSAGITGAQITGTIPSI